MEVYSEAGKLLTLEAVNFGGCFWDSQTTALSCVLGDNDRREEYYFSVAQSVSQWQGKVADYQYL